MGYAKLFSTITESSLWSEPKEVRLLFVTMLAKANSIGFVEAAVPGLSRAANLTIEEVQKSLPILENPDPFSKNPDHEGRRIIPAPGGWIVLNYEDYRSRQSEEERREYMREYMQNYRKQSVNKVKRSKESPSASVSSFASVSKRKPKNLEEVLGYASKIGVSKSDATAFYDSMEAGGWTRSGKALKDWEAHLRSYKGNGWLPSQKNRKNGAHHDIPVKADPSKIEVPERFKAWVAERYPANRESAMKWRTWSDVPKNGLRDEWWKEEKSKLPIGDML